LVRTITVEVEAKVNIKEENTHKCLRHGGNLIY
jgi:hypothetical protein